LKARTPAEVRAEGPLEVFERLYEIGKEDGLKALWNVRPR
jgi:hypothetical protein